MPDRPTISWSEVRWQRPLDPVRAVGCLRTWAADQRSQRIVLEVRASAGQVSYLVGAAPAALSGTLGPLRALGATVRKLEDPRSPIARAAYLSASTRHRPLRTDQPEAAISGLLHALVNSKKGETLVLQLVLGPRRVPLAIPNNSPSSVVMPWWQVAWLGNGGQVDGEKRSALRSKVADHGFALTVRVGVHAVDRDRQRQLLLGVLAAIRTNEASGVRLAYKHDRARHLNAATAPWRWPLRLGVPETLNLTAWPLGDADLPGQPAAHPKPLPPAPGTTTGQRIIGQATAVPGDVKLTLPITSATHGLHLLGPTGVGKSSLLSSLISADIEAGYGVVVIEPKGDLVDDVLSRVTGEHEDRIVVLDPADEAPVGFNPLATHGRRPDLVADRVLAIFKQLYGSAIGPRSQDILYAGLLTLAQRSDASLTMLPLLLTNPGFRRSITGSIRDPLVLEPFWASFDSWSDSERASAIAPALNKIRPLLRPGLRGVLGQRRPRFDLSQVFTEGKVLLVPLRSGVIGPEAAKLLGSLLLAELWQTIQGRAAVAGNKRKPVVIYVDEAPVFLNLGTDLGDALAQTRGYGVAFVLAHQFMSQLSTDMRAAVLANTRSRICFQLPAADAAVMAKGHPELTALDFSALGQYEIYASLFANGSVTPYASGRTLPPVPGTRDPVELYRLSRQNWGQPLDAVEADFAALLDQPTSDDAPLGRRRRQA